MGPIVRLVGSGIGLASEAIAARKARKAEKEKAQWQGDSTSHGPSLGPSPSRSREPSPDPPAYSTLDPSSADYGLVEAEDDQHAKQLVEEGHAVPYDQLHEVEHSDVEEDDDEAYWELDEHAAALEDAPPYEESDRPAYKAKDGSGHADEEEKPDVHKLVKQFLSKHPVPSHTPPVHPLPCPVIIPQRRPHTKSRGFIRAYSPILEDCNVDQSTFLEFLNVFQKASQVRLATYITVWDLSANFARPLLSLKLYLSAAISLAMFPPFQPRSRLGLHKLLRGQRLLLKVVTESILSWTKSTIPSSVRVASTQCL